MNCNWRGIANTWRGAVTNCSHPAAAKCKICNQGTCAEHKQIIGQISPGVTVTVCRKCYDKALMIVNLGTLKKVQPNLCCVLDTYGSCVCGNIICYGCWMFRPKPHNDCEYLRCRAVMARIKALK